MSPGLVVTDSIDRPSLKRLTLAEKRAKEYRDVLTAIHDLDKSQGDVDGHEYVRKVRSLTEQTDVEYCKRCNKSMCICQGGGNGKEIISLGPHR